MAAAGESAGKNGAAKVAGKNAAAKAAAGVKAVAKGAAKGAIKKGVGVKASAKKGDKKNLVSVVHASSRSRILIRGIGGIGITVLYGDKGPERGSEQIESPSQSDVRQAS